MDQDWRLWIGHQSGARWRAQEVGGAGEGGATVGEGPDGTDCSSCIPVLGRCVALPTTLLLRFSTRRDTALWWTSGPWVVSCELVGEVTVRVEFGV